MNTPWLLKIRPAFIASALKKTLGYKREIVKTPYGIFYIDKISDFGSRLISEQGYEPGMITILKKFLNKDDIFLDLGANEGFFSILAAQLVGENGLVICLEPQTRLLEIIYRNIKENNITNIEVLQKCISDTTGISTLLLSPSTNTGSSGLYQSTKYRNATQLVPKITLGRLFELLNIRSVKLAKMDIEGSEYEAILGAKEVFQNKIIKNLALEIHPQQIRNQGKNPDEISKFLNRCGYKMQLVEGIQVYSVHD